MAASTSKSNDKKNTAATKQGAAKKPRSNANASGRKKPTKKELEQLRIEEEIRRAEYIQKRNRIVSVMLFAFSLFLFSFVLIPSSVGTVWHSIRGFIFGILGYSAFLLPCITTYIAVIIALEKKTQSSSAKFIEGLVLIVLISAFAFVISHEGEIFFGADVSKEYLKYFYDNKIGWGIFGAILGEGLLLIGSSKAPAIAILLILIFLDIMLLTGATLIRLFTAVKKPADKVSSHIEKVRENKYDYNDGISNDDELSELKKKRRRGHLYVYDKQDLLNGETTEDKTEETEQTEPEIQDNPIIVEAEPITDEEEPIVDIKETVTPETKTEKANIIKDIFALAVEKQARDEEKKLSKSEISAESQNVADEIEESETDEVPDYILPPLACLRLPQKNSRAASQADLKSTADKLIESLKSFNVDASVIEVVPGPSVTRYEVAPARGVKISKFTGLADDLALHLAAPAGVRIEAPIPNKSAIGIEVPNRGRTTVTMREIVDSDIYRKSKSKINVALGKDIAGNVVCADLAKMPHLLIAGTTGSGKSVCLNAMIVSLLYNAKPSEVKILLIDPKQVEFSVYNGIPHLLVPVVSDARKAAGALGWAVTEMLNRYKTLNDNGVRDIGAYNSLCESDETLQKMSQIVIVIDELSDLMSVAPSEVEGSITRLAQMARAAGMHLVVATQRPSVDVITGLIKANIPSRIALSVSSQVDSRTIIDTAGAEKLLGLGDMLYYPVGISKPLRVQGCFLSDEEIENVVEFVKTQEATSYDDEIQQEIEKQALSSASGKKGAKDTDGGSSVSDADKEIIMKAAELVIDNPDKASISSLQRHLSLGFAKAGRIMDALEDKGVVGPHAGSKPRKVIMTKAQWYEMNAMTPTVTETDGESDDE